MGLADLFRQQSNSLAQQEREEKIRQADAQATAKKIDHESHNKNAHVKPEIISNLPGLIDQRTKQRNAELLTISWYDVEINKPVKIKNLAGVAKIVADYCKKEGFDVFIHTSEFDDEGYHYRDDYLYISW